MTDRDLHEALRQQGLDDVDQVAEARLERDGSVSVIKRKQDKQELRVAEVTVADGVQTVRLEVGSG